MAKKTVLLSFPQNSANLGLEPSILNVAPQGDDVVYCPDNRSLRDSDVDKYLCSVYIAGEKEFREWAMRHDTRKIVAGGYHPTMFPERFLNFADRIVMGPCDDLEATLSQQNVQFERSHYDDTQIGNARFVEGHVLRNLPSVDGWKRVIGEIPVCKQTKARLAPEQPSGKAEVLTDRIIPGVLTFKNLPRFDLYDVRNNQQIIPDKKPDDLSTSINTSFGCPYTCDFCCTPVMFGPGLISKPLELVEAEAEMVGRRLDAADKGGQSRYLFIRDENFTLQKDFDKRLELIASKTGARIYLFASANTLGERVVDTMARNNVYMVCLGLEDPTKGYDKNKKLDEAIGRLKQHGIGTYLSFIVDPIEMAGTRDGKTGAQRAQEFYALLERRFHELKPEMVCGNFLMPFPGTPQWDKYYHMVGEGDFQRYNSKDPFLVKNDLVREKMKYFMFDVQWRYYTSDLYNNEVRKFETGDTLHLRFLELKEQFDRSWDAVRELRP